MKDSMNLIIEIPKLHKDMRAVVSHYRAAEIADLKEGVNKITVERNPSPHPDESIGRIIACFIGMEWLYWSAPLLPFQAGATMKIKAPEPLRDGLYTMRPEDFWGPYDKDIQWECVHEEES
ncbi:MAG: hypothetical protein ABGX83_05350 [Nitrospira sp.]